MEKEAIYRLLEEEGIPFAVTEHPPVFTMEGTHSLVLPYPEDMACNLFVRDDKKRFYGLITVKGEGRLDLKAFQKEQGTRRLSLASPADLASFLQLAPGSVTPFGLLNDAGHRVEFFLDRRFLEGAGRIGIHPNENTATVYLAARDLLRLLEKKGTTVHVAAMALVDNEAQQAL